MARPVFRFLDFEIVTARREIRRGGEALNIEPKVYDLLLYLLERRDRSVSKEELQEAIWPNVIVTEAALTRCVMKARNALDDIATERRVIKTLHSHGYQFIAEVTEIGVESAPPRVRDNAEGIDRIPIAVLPFANLGNDPEQDFLADGLTQDIITDLSRNGWLFVISANSSSHYRDRNASMQQLMSELGAHYVVEGSLRCYDDKIRVTASLTDAMSGAREWSERYDEPLTDFFEIQDEISSGIASSLGSQVRRAEGQRAIRADPEALDVWGLLHRGMGISWSRFNRESNYEAECLYRRALAKAPQNGRAKAFLGASIAMKVANGYSDDVKADTEEAWQLGEEAVRELPEDPMVMMNYGHMNTCLGHARSAVGLLERSLELDPSSAYGHGVLSFALTASGRAEEAIATVTRALRLSPRDPAAHWYLAMLSWAYLQLGQYEDAAREACRSINSFPGWQTPWATLAVAEAGLGQWREARERAAVAAKLEPGIPLDGYTRFFHYIVRDPVVGKRVNGWLQQLWPKSSQERSEAPARLQAVGATSRKHQ